MHTFFRNIIYASLFSVLPMRVKDCISILDQLLMYVLHPGLYTETEKFISTHLQGAEQFLTGTSLIDYALTHRDNSGNGLVCEFGVGNGSSITYIARQLPTDNVYGFDSFNGLPEDWHSRIRQGAYATNKLPRVPRNVALIKGLFQDTLPTFVESHQGKCTFVHIDCDLYSSTKTIFQYLQQRLGPGTIIVFDEFFNYPGWENGEYKAFHEFIAVSEIEFRYLGYCKSSQQVAVVLCAES